MAVRDADLLRDVGDLVFPDAVRIGHLDGDAFDPHCAWLRRRGIGGDGAVLVRPDRFVACRSLGAAAAPAAALGMVLGVTLRSPITQPA
jgi:2,4-dichlorophenol 6-monooxygenase